MNTLDEGNTNGHDALASLFPENVEIVVSRKGGNIEELYSSERALIEHAVEKRQHDFAAGRLCARKALADLGIEEFPILMDAKRAPIWPNGISGSISHAKGICAAVVSRVPVQAQEALGLDIEEVGRIQESIWDYAFGPEELAWLNKVSGEMSKESAVEAQKWASVIFAAKEAFYKAQYQLTTSWLGFQDVVVLVDRESGDKEVLVKLLVDLGKWKKGQEFRGRYAFFESYVACGIRISSLG